MPPSRCGAAFAQPQSKATRHGRREAAGAADPGGILISDRMFREVEGNVDAACEDRGEQRVKNMSRPPRVDHIGSA
jgi:hypothetical protein